MQAFKKIKSRAIPLLLNNIDTDMIIPAQYLRRIEQTGYGTYLFKNIAHIKALFHQEAYKNAKILLSGKNFACGSSREHAVWALQQAGISVIIAESFSDIFYNNALKNGLLLIQLSYDVMDALQNKAQNNATFIVDLVQQKIEVEEILINFDYDPFRKWCLINGYDDLEYLLAHSEKIEKYFLAQE